MIKRILDLLGWLGVILVLAAVAVRFLRPQMQPLYSGLAIAGLVCTLLYILSQWREFGRAFSRRQAKYGALAGASVLVVLGLLVGINWIASRRSHRWDLTAAKQFTLSDQTHKVLDSLTEPVRVKVFSREEEFQRFRDQLDGYERASNRLSVEYIDVDKQPAVTREYQVQSYGTVVFEYGDRIERTTQTTEQDLTNALIRAVQGQQKRIYFVQGHGERDPVSSERDGYSAVADALRSDNFEVEKLVLAQQTEVPAEAAVVVVAGPKTDYFPAELDMLRRYLGRGGKVLFLLDPPEAADNPQLPGLIDLLREWAIEVGNNVVVDVSGFGQLIGTDASVPVAASYPSHPITERFGSLITAYPLARSVGPVSGGADGRYAQSFIETSPRSWAETDIRQLMTTGQVAPEEDKGDKRGPVSIGAVVSAPAAEDTSSPGANGEAAEGEEEDQSTEAGAADTPKPETRIAAVGDSDFIANFALGIQGNRDLFLNTVSWLTQQENLISIRTREPEDRRITLTADQERRIFWLSIVLIPGLIFFAGIQAWWRRR